VNSLRMREQRGVHTPREFVALDHLLHDMRLYKSRGEVSAMRERSEFVLKQGRWLYTRGEAKQPRAAPWRPGRNQSCPCGSGLKFKRCCALT
jgi:uncharacterized protein YchJ